MGDVGIMNIKFQNKNWITSSCSERFARQLVEHKKSVFVSLEDVSACGQIVYPGSINVIGTVVFDSPIVWSNYLTFVQVGTEQEDEYEEELSNKLYQQLFKESFEQEVDFLHQVTVEGNSYLEEALFLEALNTRYCKPLEWIKVLSDFMSCGIDYDLDSVLASTRAQASTLKNRVESFGYTYAYLVDCLAQRWQLDQSVCLDFRYDARKGWGAFADCEIKAGTYLGSYFGRYVTLGENLFYPLRSVRDAYRLNPGFYTKNCEKNKRTVVAISAKYFGSLASRYNCAHPKNTTALVMSVIDPRTGLPVSVCIAQRDIRPQEEITWFYGKKYAKMLGISL